MTLIICLVLLVICAAPAAHIITYIINRLQYTNETLDTTEEDNNK